MSAPDISPGLPQQLLDFQLPPHDWPAFVAAPRRAFGLFEDRVAEATFLRFRSTRHVRWDAVCGALGMCLYYTLLPPGVVVTATVYLSTLVILVLSFWDPSVFLASPGERRVQGRKPRPLTLRQRFLAFRGRRASSDVGVLQASARIKAEVRAAIVLEVAAACIAFCTVATHILSLFRLVVIAKTQPLPPLYPFSREAFYFHRIPYGAAFPLAFVFRPVAPVAAAAAVVNVFGYVVLGWALGLLLDPLGELVAEAILCAGTLGLMRVVEERERWLFLAVVGSRHLALATRYRSVASTAATVAPPFAAAQLHAVMTPGEAATLTPTCGRNVAVGMADVADFVRLATGLLPQHTVRVLHRLFVAYDEGARRFGVDRAGSFADGYIVVSGLGTSSKDKAKSSIGAEADSVVAAARRVSDFALWQVKAGAPAVAWEVFGAGDVTIPARAAVNVGTVAGGVGGVAGAMECTRFFLHGPAVHTGIAMLRRAPPGRVAVDAATLRVRGSRAAAEAEGVLLDGVVPDNGDVTAHATGSVMEPPAPADTAVDSADAAAEQLLLPGAARVRLHPWLLVFEDADTERRAMHFLRYVDTAPLEAGALAAATVYGVAVVATVCDCVMGWRHAAGDADPAVPPPPQLGLAAFTVGLVASVALLALATGMELVRSRVAWVRTGALRYVWPATALLVYCAGLWRLPVGAKAGNAVTFSAVPLCFNTHFIPLPRSWLWGSLVTPAAVWLTHSLVAGARVGWQKGVLVDFFVLCAVLSIMSPFMHYAARLAARVRFQAVEHDGYVQTVMARRLEAQERLARSMLPPHTFSGVAHRWEVLCAPEHERSAAERERCLVWRWHDTVVLHCKVACPAATTCPGAALEGYTRFVSRWRRLLDLLGSVVARCGTPGLLEHIEAVGDEFVVAGPFPHTEADSAVATLQARATAAAAAALLFCREAAALLHADGASLLAALGAGPSVGALIGAEGLTFRLLGLARREATVLLLAAPGCPHNEAHSMVYATPAFRRVYSADVAPSTLAIGVGLDAASRRLAVSRAAPGDPSALPCDEFTAPLKWRVKGLGVIMTSTVRGLAGQHQ